jgi:hypothetical protein
LCRSVTLVIRKKVCRQEAIMKSFLWNSYLLLLSHLLGLSFGFHSTPPPHYSSIPSRQKTFLLQASVTDPIVNGDEVVANNIPFKEATTTEARKINDATTITSTAVEQPSPNAEEKSLGIEKMDNIVDIDDDDDEDEDEDEDMSMFDIVAGRAAVCLFESELRCDAKGPDYSHMVSSNAVNWINDASAFALHKAVDRVKLKVRGHGNDAKNRGTFILKKETKS